MVNPHGYPWLTLPHKKSSSNDWAHHACLTFWHKHRTKVCCCKQAPSLIPRKATHLKRQLHLHGMPVEFYPKVLVDTSNPWYNWTKLRKLPALALCSSASVPSPWLLLFLVASSFYEITICAFQTAMLRPLTTSCFSIEMP